MLRNCRLGQREFVDNFPADTCFSVAQQSHDSHTGWVGNRPSELRQFFSARIVGEADRPWVAVSLFCFLFRHRHLSLNRESTINDTAGDGSSQRSFSATSIGKNGKHRKERGQFFVWSGSFSSVTAESAAAWSPSACSISVLVFSALVFSALAESVASC